MIKVKTQTKVKTDGMNVKKFLENLKGASRSYVTIGLHEDAGSYSGTNPPSVVEVGLWNEFGTATSPERSWLRSAIDESEGQINAWREEAINNMIHKGWTLEKALHMMGFRIQVLVQNKIKSNVPPPNAESTAEAKAKHGVAQQTLIDTGLMLRSVVYKVVME